MAKTQMEVKNVRDLPHNWQKGFVGDLEFEAKVFPEGSVHGINGGRVSKLGVYDGPQCVVGYDRGWDTEPVEDKHREALMAILRYYGCERCYLCDMETARDGHAPWCKVEGRE